MWLYGHVMRDERTQFNMRVEDEFLAALDKIRAAERPACSRAYMLRKLVFDAEAAGSARQGPSRMKVAAQGLFSAQRAKDARAKAGAK